MSTMKKQKKTEPESMTKKEGRCIRDVIPVINEKLPREPYLQPLISNFDREYVCETEPFVPFPEWPGDDIANVIFFS